MRSLLAHKALLATLGPRITSEVNLKRHWAAIVQPAGGNVQAEFSALAPVIITFLNGSDR
jgi:hypothetical protein